MCMVCIYVYTKYTHIPQLKLFKYDNFVWVAIFPLKFCAYMDHSSVVFTQIVWNVAHFDQLFPHFCSFWVQLVFCIDLGMWLIGIPSFVL